MPKPDKYNQTICPHNLNDSSYDEYIENMTSPKDRLISLPAHAPSAVETNQSGSFLLSMPMRRLNTNIRIRRCKKVLKNTASQKQNDDPENNLNISFDPPHPTVSSSGRSPTLELPKIIIIPPDTLASSSQPCESKTNNKNYLDTEGLKWDRQKRRENIIINSKTDTPLVADSNCANKIHGFNTNNNHPLYIMSDDEEPDIEIDVQNNQNDEGGIISSNPKNYHFPDVMDSYKESISDLGCEEANIDDHSEKNEESSQGRCERIVNCENSPVDNKVTTKENNPNTTSKKYALPIESDQKEVTCCSMGFFDRFFSTSKKAAAKTDNFNGPVSRHYDL